MATKKFRERLPTHGANIEEMQNLVRVLDTVFEKNSNPSTEHLNDILLNNSVFNLGAFVDNTLVGGLSAHELPLISGNKKFYLYDIGVLPTYQKMGIGTSDEDAVAFYRSLNEEEGTVQHFNLTVSRDY